MIYVLFILSLAVNCVFVWYIRKLIKQLSFGVNYVQQLQGLLEEYTASLEGMLELEMYYGDDTMTAAVKNTKMVIEACKTYERSVLVKEDVESEENDENSDER